MTEPIAPLAKHVAENPDQVDVAVVRAVGASKGYVGKVVRYHRSDCTHFNSRRDVMSMPLGRAEAEERGFQPCVFCCTLTLAAWSKQIGLDHRFVWLMINGSRRTIKKSVALRALRAIGEPPHPSLVAYVKALPRPTAA
jgi:hypothetical protein